MVAVTGCPSWTGGSAMPLSAVAPREVFDLVVVEPVGEPAAAIFFLVRSTGPNKVIRNLGAQDDAAPEVD